MTETSSGRGRSDHIIVHNTIRFTVICPELVRIEYADKGKFVEDPTLFAVNREYPKADFSSSTDAEGCRIETDSFSLIYTGRGERPDADNLAIVVKETGLRWTPGKEDKGNLGGPLQTLDGCSGPEPLPEGLLSREGWHIIDDSRSHILQDGWISARLSGAGDRDWYFFAYGSDYKAGLRAFSLISGTVPLPRRHIFGSWYCRWWAYTSDDYRKLVQEYRENDFPLDIMVMDMDWHRKDGNTGFGWVNRHVMGWTGWSWNRELLPDIEELLGELKDEELYVTLNAHPHDGVRSTEDMYPEFMRELGYDPQEGKDLPFLSDDRDYMNAYFTYAHHPHEEIGVDFWWVDWQQDSLMPYVYHIPYLRHLPWLNYLYFENSRRKGKRGLGFSRWAGWGDHRHPIHFSGDTAAEGNGRQESLLYEDDGTTDNYTGGGYVLTRLDQSQKDGGISIQISAAEGTFDGALERRSIEIVWHGPERITGAECKGKRVNITENDGTQCVRLPQEPVRESVRIELQTE